MLLRLKMCPLGFFFKVWMTVFFIGRKSGKYIEDCSSCQGCQSCDTFYEQCFCCELFEVIKKVKLPQCLIIAYSLQHVSKTIAAGKMCLAKSIKHVSQFKLSFMSKVNPF